MIRRLLRLPPRTKERLAADLDEEIQLHLELRAQRLIRRGLAPDAARAEARLRFGGLEASRDSLYRAARRRERRLRLREALRELSDDVMAALRRLAREPAFCAVVIFTLALGIGANAAVFGVIDHLLLRGPEHVEDARGVVRLYRTAVIPGQGELTRWSVPYALYTTLRTRTSTFRAVAGYSPGEAVLGRGEDAEVVARAAATWDIFPLLGVRPHLGRFFMEEEDHPPRGEAVAVLGHSLWQRRFGADPTVLGRTVELGGQPYAVVGVAPPGLTAPDRTRVDVWTPMTSYGTSRPAGWATQWNVPYLRLLARLEDGVSPTRASADATAAYQQAFAGMNRGYADARLWTAPLHLGFDGREPVETTVSRWLWGIAGVLLLIACANVTNLYLARGTRRERELGVRLALGVGRGRLARLLLVESLILAAAGGAAALLLAHWGGTLMRALLAPGAMWSAPLIDGRVLAFTAALTLLTGALVGLVPALTAGRRELTDALRAGVREGGLGRSPARAALTVLQCAAAVVLLMGAGLFVRSLGNLTGLHLGIDTERVLAASVTWHAAVPTGAAGEPVDSAAASALRAERLTIYARALERLAGAAGVRSAAVSAGTPFHVSESINLNASGWDSLPVLPGISRYPLMTSVTSGYFETVGTRVLRGRGFTPSDRGGDRVAIVSETMERTLWPERGALGECLHLGPAGMPCTRVVGVVEDVRQSLLLEQPPMQYYLPLGVRPTGSSSMLLVRPEGDPAALAPELRALLQGLAGPDGFVQISTLQERVDPQVRPWRTGSTLFALFGLLALLVAAVGLYGVISYLVARRTHEVGVRIALGARAGQIGRMVLRQGAVLVLIGVGIGAAVTLAAGRFLEPLLFQVSSRDPLVFVAVTAVVLIVALVASLLPALRAARVDPLVALRAQ